MQDEFALFDLFIFFKKKKLWQNCLQSSRLIPGNSVRSSHQTVLGRVEDGAVEFHLFQNGRRSRHKKSDWRNFIGMCVWWLSGSFFGRCLIKARYWRTRLLKNPISEFNDRIVFCLKFFESLLSWLTSVKVSEFKLEPFKWYQFQRANTFATLGTVITSILKYSTLSLNHTIIVYFVSFKSLLPWLATAKISKS